MMSAHYILALEWTVRIVMAVVIIFRQRSPAKALVWMVVVAFVPVAGAAAYLLVGENRLGTRTSRRHLTVKQRVRLPGGLLERFAHVFQPLIDDRLLPIASLAEAQGASQALGGNDLVLLADTNEVMERIASDIRAAKHHCHLLYYIFQVDLEGRRIAGELIAARKRGLACRVLVDAAGSKPFLRGALCRELREAGVAVEAALPVNPLRAAVARMDFRNHRKLAVLDGRIAYAGSHNISGPIYPRKARYGAWVDATVRITGPVVPLLQEVFLQDWWLAAGCFVEDDTLFPLVETPLGGQIPVQVMPSGPDSRDAPFLELILQALAVARERVTFTSPYFVPGDAIVHAMRAAARRGVEVVLVVPKHSDNYIVQAAGRSQYGFLLEAGVKIHEFKEGLLHAKTLTVDRGLSAIGSANLDLRSFCLNFELGLVIYSSDFTSQLHFLQTNYLERSERLTEKAWRNRSRVHIIGDNLAKLLTPLL